MVIIINLKFFLYLLHGQSFRFNVRGREPGYQLIHKVFLTCINAIKPPLLIQADIIHKLIFFSTFALHILKPKYQISFISINNDIEQYLVLGKFLKRTKNVSVS